MSDTMEKGRTPLRELIEELKEATKAVEDLVEQLKILEEYL